MSKHQTFIFKDYVFNPSDKTLKLHYGLDQAFSFTETYSFDFDYVDYDQETLDKALQTLFFIAGVSYYKAYIPSEIKITKGQLNKSQADFLSKTYERGLGEFWFINNLDPRTKVVFPVNDTQPSVVDRKDAPAANGLLVGIGGGKDSLVVVEALRNSGLPITTWSLSHRDQLEPLVNKIGFKHLYVGRTIDPKLIELNSQGALNGHVPISAILAAVGVVVTVLSSNRDIVVGNEQSANEPALLYQGVQINHQYSKSQEFEADFQNYLKQNLGDAVRYYSFLRSLSELRIAEIFAKIGFNKYRGVFSSCNRAYTLKSDSLFWCGECPKCAFIFLALTPFIVRHDLESLWGGKNLLLDGSLHDTYLKLLGIAGDKPLDCVGEIKESRAAMNLAQAIYPELKSQYQFSLPEDYDYKALSSNELPDDIRPLFDNFIAQFQE